MAFNFNTGKTVTPTAPGGIKNTSPTPETPTGGFNFNAGQIIESAPVDKTPATTLRVDKAIAGGGGAFEVGMAIGGVDEVAQEFEEEVSSDLKRRQDAFAVVLDDYAKGKQGLGSTAYQLGGQAVALTAGTLFSAAKAGFKGIGNIMSFLTPDTVEKPVVEVAKASPKAIIDTLFSEEEQEKAAAELQSYIEAYGRLKESYPTFARNLEATLNYAMVLPGAKAGKLKSFLPATKTYAEKAVYESTGQFATLLDDIKFTTAASKAGIKLDAANTATERLKYDKNVAKLADQYRNIFNPSKSQIQKTDKSIIRGARDPVETLAELQPKIEKIEGNRLGTLDAANDIRTNVVEPAQDAVTTLMKDIGQQARVNIDDFQARAVAELRRRFDGPEQDQAVKAFNARLASLVAKRQGKMIQGAKGERLMQADAFDEIKANFWQNSKFNKLLQANDPANVRSMSNRYAGHIAKETIEGVVKDLDSGIDIGRLNRQLGDYYEAANFLEQAHGGKLPGGTLGGLFTKTIGGVAGTSGGPLGVMLGAKAGSIVADILINPEYSTAYRRWAINRIKVNNPTIADEVEAILKKRGALREATPKLQAPTTIYSQPPKAPDVKFSQPKATTPTEIEASQKAAGIYKEPTPPLQLPAAGQTPIQLPAKTPVRKLTQEETDAMTGRKIAAQKTSESKAVTAKDEVFYHGTSSKEFKSFGGDVVYLAKNADEAKAFAENPIIGGGKNAGTPRVLSVKVPAGKIKSVDEAVQDVVMDGGDLDALIAKEAKKARAEGYEFLSFNHPSSVVGADDFEAIVAINPKKLKAEATKTNPFKATTHTKGDIVKITDKATGKSQEVVVTNIHPDGLTVIRPDGIGIPNKASFSKWDISFVRKGEVPKMGPSINSPEMIALEKATETAKVNPFKATGPEANPFKGSKVNQPVFHGTLEKFDEFDISKAGSNTGYENAKWGIFFSDDATRSKDFVEIARGVGDKRPVNVVEARIDMKNPLDLTLNGITTNEKQASVIYEALTGKKIPAKRALKELDQGIDLGTVSEFFDELYSNIKNKKLFQDAGYDGIIAEMGRDGGRVVKEYVVFEPTQIMTKAQLVKNKSGEPLRKKLIEEAIKKGDVQLFLDNGGTFKDMLEMIGAGKSGFPVLKAQPAKKTPAKKNPFKVKAK